jgi:hypothetical protein
MSQHERQLREAFQSHEHMTPDPAAVYARVQELSRTLRMRRRGAQIAGASVLGAGLIAGGLVVPGLFGHQGDPGKSAGFPVAASSAPAVVVTTPAPPSAPPSPEPSYSEVDLQKYWDSGFGLEQAETLAQLWRIADLTAVKAEAGRRLRAGQKLPVKPYANTTPVTAEEKQVRAFFSAGYTSEDAATLARLWKKATPYDAKVEGGKRLLAGRTLPIRP